MLSLQVQTEESENTVSDNFYKDELKKRKIKTKEFYLKSKSKIHMMIFFKRS